MSPLDLLKLIPEAVRQQVRDALVDFMTEQANLHLNRTVANKLRAMPSDAAFNKAFDAGLARAVRRFVAEYEGEGQRLPDFKSGRRSWRYAPRGISETLGWLTKAARLAMLQAATVSACAEKAHAIQQNTD